MHLIHHCAERGNSMARILDVKNLKISFRTNNGIVQAVRDISFSMNKGETLAIVGESGSGKSVTARAIMGILAGNAITEGGEVHFDEQDLTKISEEAFHKIRGNKISMIFQDPFSSLNPIARIGKQLTEAMVINGRINRRLARRDFNKLFKRITPHIKDAAKVKLVFQKYSKVCHEYKMNQEKMGFFEETLEQQEPNFFEDLYCDHITDSTFNDFLLNIANTLAKQDLQKEDEQSISTADVDAAHQFIEALKLQAQKMGMKLSQRMAKQRAIHLMEEVGIPEAAARYRQYPFQFSGGMRQRIVIAIALAANPDLLICDEPTTALDVTIQAQILDLINHLKQQRGLSIIFITHDLGVVANVADHIAVMYAGKIVEYGTAHDVFFEPSHPYTWALLSSMPDLETTEKLDAIPGTPPDMIHPPKGDAFAARNKYALGIDFEAHPPFFDLSPTHKAATWLLHPDAPKAEPPKIVQERINRMRTQEDGVL